MERNGNGGTDIGSFEDYFRRRIASLEANGMPGSDIDSMKSRGRQIAAALAEFRTQRRTLSTSGELTARGLQKALADAASRAAGAIRGGDRLALIDEDIRRTKAKTVTAIAVDPVSALLKFMRQQEIRSALAAQDIGPHDPLMAAMAYRDAMARGDTDTLEALEGWPLKCPIDAELVEQGRQQRMSQADPVAAKKLTDLRAYRDAWVQTDKDGLAELRDFLPVPDPLPEMAGQKSGDEPPDAA